MLQQGFPIPSGHVASHSCNRRVRELGGEVFDWRRRRRVPKGNPRPFDISSDLNVNPNHSRSDAVEVLLTSSGTTQAGDVERGIAACTKIIDYDENNIDALCYRAELYVNKGDFVEAVSNFQQAANTGPDVQKVKEGWLP